MTQPADALPPAPLPLPSTGEWQDASRLTYMLYQCFRYTYDTPARELNHRLVVVPPRRHGDQRRRLHSITVSATDAQTTHCQDAHGNTVTTSRVPLVPEQIEFVVQAVVERKGPRRDALLPAAALTDPRLLRPTRLTTADPAIQDLAATMAGQDSLETAERYCAYVHEAISYVHGATSITTTAAQALAAGRGVCQDAAHVMIALCRAAGIAARYVSGHLLGEGGTHAWVEVVVADAAGARAVGFDPSNGSRAARNYLTVATGRDYTDVAPTSGTYLGTARGTLTTTKRVAVALA